MLCLLLGEITCTCACNYMCRCGTLLHKARRLSGCIPFTALTYSRCHKNGDVSVPFRAVGNGEWRSMKRELNGNGTALCTYVHCTGTAPFGTHVRLLTSLEANTKWVFVVFYNCRILSTSSHTLYMCCYILVFAAVREVTWLLKCLTKSLCFQPSWPSYSLLSIPTTSYYWQVHVLKKIMHVSGHTQ